MRVTGVPRGTKRFLSEIQNEFELHWKSRNKYQEKIDSDFAGLLYRELMEMNYI